VLTAVAVGAGWMLLGGSKKQDQESKTFQPGFRLPDKVGELMQQQVRERGVNCVAFHPDGKRVFVGDADGYLGTWDLQQRTFTRKQVSKASIHSITFSRDGTQTLLGQGDGTAALWREGEHAGKQLGTAVPDFVAVQRALFRDFSRSDREQQVLICTSVKGIAVWPINSADAKGLVKMLTFAGNTASCSTPRAAGGGPVARNGRGQGTAGLVLRSDPG